MSPCTLANAGCGGGAQGRLQPPLRHLGGWHHRDRARRDATAHVRPAPHEGTLPNV